MKNLMIISLLLTTTAAFAQKPKSATSKPTPPPPVVATTTTGPKLLTANLGLNQGAFNLGIAMDAGLDNGDMGGSFFIQNEKEDGGVTKVYQMMSFGGHVHLHVYDQANWVVDLRPGVNLSMISDVPNSSGTGKDDKTVLGPSLRWGITHRLESGSEIGIDHLEIWNWFDDDVNKSDTFTSLAFRTRF